MINNCILVFDIGKTNQKYFLFDTNYNLILQGNKKPKKLKMMTETNVMTLRK